MGRKKKSKDEWVNFIRTLFRRNRAKRPYVLPSAYIMSVADSLHRTNPSLDILYNTLSDFYATAFEKGYLRKEEDIRFFKEKQAKRQTKDWNAFKDWLDDTIHGTDNTNQNCK